MPRWLAILCLAVPVGMTAQTSAGEKDAVAVVQKIFDALAAHDGVMLRSGMLPDARFYAVRDAGDPVSIGVADMVDRITGTKDDLLERFTAPPQVSIHGRMAQVWGEYVLLRDRQFSHCGVDSVSLLQTAGGWKIAAVVYTSETTGCKGQ
jgi:hypothetical protein